MIDFTYENHNNFLNWLFSIGEEKFKDFSTKLVCSKYSLIGVKLPILKEIAKKIAKQNKLNEYIKNCTYTFFEEVMICGFLIKFLPSVEDIIDFFKEFVNKIDSWAFTDSIIADIKVVKENRQKFLPLVERLFNEKEFYARCGYIFLLDYYLCDEYIDFVFKKLSLDYDYYYVNMAKAWLLATAYLKYPTKVINFIKEFKNDFVVNKTISKIRDSFRVSKQDKDYLLSFKR